MDDPSSTKERDTRILFQKLARCAPAIELLMSARVIRSPADLLDQFRTLRNFGLAQVVDEADDTVFRAHTKLRVFVEHAQGTVSSLHELDENHEAMLNKCAKLHSRYLWALQEGEDGEGELDDFVSWALALGDSIDQSLARFDSHLSSNFSMDKTLRQREEINKEAVVQATNLSAWLAALSSSPLRQRLEEDASCAKLLLAFQDALLSRGKMARRLERCTQSIQRLREKLNSTKATTRRHELLDKAAALFEQGQPPLPPDILDMDATQLSRVQRLTPKSKAPTPSTFNPSEPQHARLFGGVAAKAWKWGKELESSVATIEVKTSTPGPRGQRKTNLPPKAMLASFEALLDELFERGSRISLCGWLAQRHEANVDLDLSASAFLAWTCAQDSTFFNQVDVRMEVKTEPGPSRIHPLRIVDAVFEPELSEAAA